MQRLAEDGLVARQPGRGSFVADAAGPSPREPADDVHPGDAPARPRRRARGCSPGSIRPSTTARGGQPRDPAAPAGRPPPPRCAAPTTEPIAIESTVLLGSCADAVMTADLAHGSLHETLGRAGIVAPARDGHDRRGRRHGRGRPPARRSAPATRCSSSDASSVDGHGRPDRGDRIALPGRSLRPRRSPSTSRRPTRGDDGLERDDREVASVRGRLVLDDRVEPGRIAIEDGWIAGIEPSSRSTAERAGPRARRRPGCRTSRPGSSTSTSTAGAATTRWAAADALDGMARAPAAPRGDRRSCRRP